MTRHITTTEKVETEFAPLYAHVEFDGSGKAKAVAISSPGKLSDSTVERLLENLSDTLTRMIREGI